MDRRVWRATIHNGHTELDVTSQVVLVVKNLLASIGRCKTCSFDPWVWKIPWRRAWQPAPVFLPGESYGQRSRATVRRVKNSPDLTQATYHWSTEAS